MKVNIALIILFSTQLKPAEVSKSFQLNYFRKETLRGDHVWTSNGPYGGSIYDIETIGTSIYIGLVSNGIYHLDNAGYWKSRRDSIQFLTVQKILGLTPCSLLAGTEGCGLWSTLDAGQSWNQNPNIPDSAVVNEIFQYDQNTLFLGTQGLGVYRSSNNGTNWTKVIDLPDGRDYQTFAKGTLPLVIYLGTDGQGIFRSVDGGVTWSDYPSPDPHVNVLKYYSISSTDYLYAGCKSGLYIMKFPDIGPWDSISSLANIHISDICRKGDSIYLATLGAGVLVGRIGDTLFYQHNLMYPMVNSIENVGDTMIAAGTSGGFFYSMDNGQTWQELNDSLDASLITDIEINPINPQSIIGVSFGSGLFRSTDNGDSWFRFGTVPFLPYLTSLTINPQDSSNMLAGSYAGIFRTTDGGANWQFTYVGSQLVNTVVFDPSNPLIAYAGTGEQFYKSVNNGQTWLPTDSGFSYNDIAVNINAPGVLYIATNRGVFKSNDYGNNLFLAGLQDTAIASIEIDGYSAARVYAGLEHTTSGCSGLWRSDDTGSTWVPTNFPDEPCADIETIHNVPLYLWAITDKNRCMLSTNGGNNWFDFGPNLFGNITSCVNFNPSTHSTFFGNYTGVYSYFDTTGPQVFISSADSFSPDGDSIDDEIAFYLSASDTHGILYWKTDIIKDSIIFIEMEGFGQPPDSILWDGFDSTGKLSNDGVYDARFYAVDGFFNVDSARTSFTLYKIPMVSGQRFATALPFGRNVAIDDAGTIHVVYSTFVPGEIFYTSSIDGINWSAPLNLSNTRNDFSMNPTIVIDALNNISIFWEEQYADSHEIVWQRNVGGSWFNRPRNLSHSPNPSVSPSVVSTSDNDLHLVWHEKIAGRVYYRHFHFSSGMWDPPLWLDNTSGQSCDPFILPHNELYVFYADNTTNPNNFDIRYRRWDGAQWLADTIVTNTAGNSYRPFAVVDSLKQIHLFWVDSTGNNKEIYYKRFNPSAGWGPDTNLSQTINQSDYPTVSFDSIDNISVFWQDSSEIFGKVFDHQLGWLNTENISNTSEGSYYPSGSFRGDLIWTEGDSTPYSIAYYKGTISDTTAPNFTIVAPETTYLNSSLQINFSVDERLQGTPEAWLKGSAGDSLAFAVSIDSLLYYSGSVFVSGISLGNGLVVVRGYDISNNFGFSEEPIYIDSRDTIPPQFTITAPDTCFLNDTLFIFFTASETLSALPTGWLKDNFQDSLPFTITEISPMNYAGEIYVTDSVFHIGPGYIIIKGTDLHGNSAITDSNIYIDSLIPPDTTPPQLIITYPDTFYLGDMPVIVLESNEILSALPIIWVKDNSRDSLQFLVFEDSSLFFSASDTVIGLEIGNGNFIVHAADTAGNITDTTCTIYINARGELLPRDSCFAFPNPTRKDYVKFMFYVNQNAHLKIDIFTLSGRKIHTIEEQYFQGGRLYEVTMSVQNLGSDIYIFRVSATAGDEKATVMKKFGVIK